MKPYCVTLIEEYPIYEPAEGGYYYTGQEVQRIRCKTRKQAQSLLAETAEEYRLEIKSPDYAIRDSKYIGQAVICLIEKKHITKSSGKQIYC